jgi:preprotein translocase subunit Sss1
LALQNDGRIAVQFTRIAAKPRDNELSKSSSALRKTGLTGVGAIGSIYDGLC